MRTGIAHFGLLFTTALLVARCDPAEPTGMVQVSYRLQMLNGVPLTCEEAAVGSLRVSLFLKRSDAAVTVHGTVPCEVDGSGRGMIRLQLPVGFYESAFVSMRTPEDTQAAMATGLLASWEYVAVEISSGGVTDFVPGVVGTFRGMPVCGNGRIEPGEECDDGNTIPGDGCSDTCQIESTDDQTFRVEWTPTQGGEDVTCTALTAATVDIVLYEAGTDVPVVFVTQISCTDRTYSFSDVAWGTYDVGITGLAGGVVEVADGTTLGVVHEAPGPTSMHLDLEGL